MNAKTQQSPNRLFRRSFLQQLFGGATLAGRDRMLGALRRLAANRELVDTQHQALATLKINGAKSWATLFSTHPPLETRIAALERFQ